MTQQEPKLPRALEEDPRAAEVEKILAQRREVLWANGALAVSRVAFAEPLVAALLVAKRGRALERGLEGIDIVLAGEAKGLNAARIKHGQPVASRISRLLVMANDGSERFYRNVESMLKKHHDRVLALVVDADSEQFAERLFGPGKQAKVVAVTDRTAVVQVLLALVG